MPVAIKSEKGNNSFEIPQRKIRVLKDNNVSVKPIPVDNQEAEIDNLGNFLIEGLEEIIAHRQGKLNFPPAL